MYDESFFRVIGKILISVVYILKIRKNGERNVSRVFRRMRFLRSMRILAKHPVWGKPCQADVAGARTQLESNRLNDTPQIKPYPRVVSSSSSCAALRHSSLSLHPFRPAWCPRSPFWLRLRCVSSQFESAFLRCAGAIQAAAATDASPRRNVSRVARAATVNCIDCFRAADRFDVGG